VSAGIVGILPHQKLDLTVREFVFDRDFKLYRSGANLTEKQRAARAKLQAVLKTLEGARPAALDEQFTREMRSHISESSSKQKGNNRPK
jgi:hypothetical protein